MNRLWLCLVLSLSLVGCNTTPTQPHANGTSVAPLVPRVTVAPSTLTPTLTMQVRAEATVGFPLAPMITALVVHDQTVFLGIPSFGLVAWNQQTARFETIRYRPDHPTEQLTVLNGGKDALVLLTFDPQNRSVPDSASWFNLATDQRSSTVAVPYIPGQSYEHPQRIGTTTTGNLIVPTATGLTWYTPLGQQTTTIETKGSPWLVSVAPDDTHVAYATDRMVCITPDDVCQAAPASLRSLRWSPDGTQLALVTDSHVVIVDRTLQTMRDLAVSVFVGGIAWHPDRSWIAVAQPKGVVILDTTLGEPVATYPTPHGVTALTWASSSDLIIAVEQGSVAAWHFTIGD